MDEPNVLREAFQALDYDAHGALPLPRIRRLLPLLSRHLPTGEARLQLSTVLAQLEEKDGEYTGEPAPWNAPLLVAFATCSH